MLVPKLTSLVPNVRMDPFERVPYVCQLWAKVFCSEHLEPGRQFGSKLMYRRAFPLNKVVFNAKVLSSKPEVLWFGDLDLHRDGAALRRIARRLRCRLFVVTEELSSWTVQWHTGLRSSVHRGPSEKAKRTEEQVIFPRDVFIEFIMRCLPGDDLIGVLKIAVEKGLATKAEKLEIRELERIWDDHLKRLGKIDATMRRDLAKRAREVLGSKPAAEHWLWKPLKELRGLAPIATEPVEATKVLLRLEQGCSDGS